ncbi:hypothetical protein AWM70_22350 [Paenibacillus yonginensis]|uniref:Uncharacterized protein n=1 Tax=Paenibacillus yonginensis TaxID=1462996 RepID=A0A1B1N6G4_9BACL|nr:hypothetical protein [Paenibacillus yonginensis]ANS76987.1 hypothetical protein AWM70_22350 [Paenibacillus yonginensis]
MERYSIAERAKALYELLNYAINPSTIEQILRANDSLIFKEVVNQTNEIAIPYVGKFTFKEFTGREINAVHGETVKQRDFVKTKFELGKYIKRLNVNRDCFDRIEIDADSLKPCIVFNTKAAAIRSGQKDLIGCMTAVYQHEFKLSGRVELFNEEQLSTFTADMQRLTSSNPKTYDDITPFIQTVLAFEEWI